MPMSTLIVLERAATMHPNVHNEMDARYTAYLTFSPAARHQYSEDLTLRP